MFFLSRLLVAPNRTRPPQRIGGGVFEHPHNVALAKVPCLLCTPDATSARSLQALTKCSRPITMHCPQSCRDGMHPSPTMLPAYSQSLTVSHHACKDYNSLPFSLGAQHRPPEHADYRPHLQPPTVARCPVTPPFCCKIQLTSAGLCWADHQHQLGPAGGSQAGAGAGAATGSWRPAGRPGGGQAGRDAAFPAPVAAAAGQRQRPAGLHHCAGPHHGHPRGESASCISLCRMEVFALTHHRGLQGNCPARLATSMQLIVTGPAKSASMPLASA